jgi:hypothetical protein
MRAEKPFLASFFDGLTGAGMFGDLRRPGAPDTLFEEEPEDVQSIDEGQRLDEQEKLCGADEGSETT